MFDWLVLGLGRHFLSCGRRWITPAKFDRLLAITVAIADQEISFNRKVNGRLTEWMLFTAINREIYRVHQKKSHPHVSQ
jgi:hypothetical protein